MKSLKKAKMVDWKQIELIIGHEAVNTRGIFYVRLHSKREANANNSVLAVPVC